MNPAKIFFLSKCITLGSVEQGETTSSSQKFEHGFLDEISQNVETYVFSIKASGSRRKASDQGRRWSYEQVSVFYLVIKIIWACRKHKVSIVFSGYGLSFVLFALFIQLFGARCYSFIYDTHLLATEGRTGIRAKLVNLYFKLGFELALKLHGWIVLNEAFVQKLAQEGRRTPRSLKIPVGLQLKPQATDEQTELSPPIKVVFAGTLNYDNGCHLLVELLERYSGQPLCLSVYGDGPYARPFENLSLKDTRLTYHGRRPNREVVSRLEQSDLIIHLRDPNSIGRDYTYPSKLVEYISTGKPVISNKFQALEKIDSNCLFSTCEFTSESLAQTIDRFIGHGSTNSELKKFQKQNFDEFRAFHSWSNIVPKIQSFIVD